MIYDKRKLKRYDVFLIVEFKPLRSPGGFSIGITRDLSPEGFSLETQTIECQRGDIMEFRLKHPDADWTVDISGEVVWRNHSWYKYVIGIKFLEVNEEQNTKILKLMSAITDKANNPELIGKDSESLLDTEKEKMPEAILDAGAMDNPFPVTGITNADHITLNNTDHCELTGTERTFISGEVFGTRSDNSKKDTNDSQKRVEEANPDHEYKYAMHSGPGPNQDTAQATYENIDTAKNNLKKKLWLYVPFAMVVIIIFVIALPMMIRQFNIPSIPASTESADYANTEKDNVIPASNNIQLSSQVVNEPPAPLPVQKAEANNTFPAEQDQTVKLRQASARDISYGIPQPISIDKTVVKGKMTEEAAINARIGEKINNTSETNNANIRKPELNTGTKAGPRKIENGNKIDLIANIDETIKNLQTIQNVTPRETEVIIETEKTTENNPLVKSGGQPVTSQVVKLDETPAAAAVQERIKIPVVEQEVKAPEEKKEGIKKTEQALKMRELPNVALLVKRDKSRNIPNNSSDMAAVSTADLLRKWQHIGSTKSGIPLFIAPDNISHPYEHVVNLLVKASVNKKDFVNMLAINCSQIKLRILEERNGNNPVFTSYSNEWKDINPDSMILYNSACPEKK